METPTPSGMPRRAMVLGGAVAAIALIAGGIAFLASHLGNGSIAAAGTPVASAACPAPDTHPTWPGSPSATISAQDANSVTTVRVGQTIEVDLDATYRWKYGTPQPAALQPQTPAGYYDAARHLCVWRFTVQQAGDTFLPFERRLICEPGKLCTDLVIYYRFAIHATS